MERGYSALYGFVISLKRRAIVIYNLTWALIEDTPICESVCATETSKPSRSVANRWRGLA